jgi:putative serine protease PepD
LRARTRVALPVVSLARSIRGWCLAGLGSHVLGFSGDGDEVRTPMSDVNGADPIRPGDRVGDEIPAAASESLGPRSQYERRPAPPRRRPGRTFAAVIVGAIAGSLIFAGGFTLAARSGPATGPAASPVTSAASAAATDALEVAAAKVLPSVVNVAVSSPAFSGVGSGIILRSDGYILTNNHVVEGATRITVTFGTNDLPARVVGTDPTTDIAVIHVAKTGLPAAAIGSAMTLKVGETVIAIGSPFGLDKTVTSGIVSALHRSDLESGMSGITSYTNLIQTDAAINPGNSGGALADLSGAVVGMNTLIQSPSGTLGAAQSAGIGFAIPIDFAKSVADTIIAGKKVTHPYLGASYLTVTPDLAAFYGLGASSGALVQDVTSGSPAASAGIRVGDIIVKFGTHTIASMEDLFAAVDGSTVGAPIPVELDRNGRTVTVSVTLVAQ